MKKILGILVCLMLSISVFSQQPSINSYGKFSEIEKSKKNKYDSNTTLEDMIQSYDNLTHALTSIDFINYINKYNLAWINDNKVYVITYEPLNIPEKNYNFATYNTARQSDGTYPCKERNLYLYCRDLNGWKKVAFIRKDDYKYVTKLNIKGIEYEALNSFREIYPFTKEYNPSLEYNNGGTVIKYSNGIVVVEFLTLNWETINGRLIRNDFRTKLTFTPNYSVYTINN